MKKCLFSLLLFFVGLLSPVFSPQPAAQAPVAREVLSAMVTNPCRNTGKCAHGPVSRGTA